MPKIFISRVRLAIIVTAVLVFTAACHHQVKVVSLQGTGGVNAAHQLDKPYLVLVSIDGFRWDYMDRYSTPNLDQIAATGSRAERLLPVFPSLTFPNHYSIATGLYPAHHGLVSNDFPDPARDKWYSLKDRTAVADPGFYNGEPIWVTAETQGMVAASFFFVGSEAPVMGVHPSHWRTYNGEISGEDRVDQVLAWLAMPELERPHLYTLYFEDVDSHSHWYGPGSPENIAAICHVDRYLGRLARGIAKLPHAGRINIIVLSDHGLGAYLDEPPFILDEHVDTTGMTIVEGGSYMFLHLDPANAHRARTIADTVNHHWRHGRAWLANETPAQWHIDDNPRFPDVILTPEMGYAVLSSADKNRKVTSGDHGWAPEYPAMHGFFVASGPNIKSGLSIGPVSMVDVYPLMTAILGLEGAENIDGDSSKLATVLYTNSNR